MKKLDEESGRFQAPRSRRLRGGRLLGLGVAAIGTVTFLGVVPASHAESFAQAFKSQVIDKAKISGHFRVYDFRRWHNGNQPYPAPQTPQDQQDRSFDGRGDAIGGDFTVHTGAMYGLSAGFALYTQHRLVKYDDPIVGLGEDLNQITEGYLQFQQQGVRVRAGRQLINTPFANGDMFTMLPRSFYGVSGTLSLFNNFASPGPGEEKDSNYEISEYMPFAYNASSSAPDAKLYMGRFTRSLSRFSDQWSSENTFGYPAGRQSGFFTTGVQYQQQLPAGGLLGQAWYYNFFNIAKMGYFETGYEFPKLMEYGPRPFARVQYLHEGESGTAALGSIDATEYGAKIGLRGPDWTVSLLYEHAPVHRGSWRNGAFVHPYTDLSGVLYDDTMNAGLEDIGPGTSYGIRISGHPTPNLKLYTRYVHYKADYGINGDYYSIDQNSVVDGGAGYPSNVVIHRGQTGFGVGFGATYQLAGLSPKFQNFSIGDNIGLTGWEGQHTFVDNRVRFIYTF